MWANSTRYSEETALAVCEAIAAGQTLRQIDARADMPCWSAIRKWLLKYPDFARMYREAQGYKADWEFAGMDDLERRLLEPKTIDGEPNSKWVNPQSIRVLLDSMRWRLGKMKPTLYGDHKKITVDGGLDYSKLLASLDNRRDKMIDVTPEVVKG